MFDIDWFPLIDFDNYEINKQGIVRNKKTKNFIKSNSSTGGKERVVLQRNGTTRGFMVDELVAKQFIANPNGYIIVRHKDNNMANSCVGNLEWVECINEEYEKAKRDNKVIKDEYYTTWYPLEEFPDSVYEINKMGQFRNKKTKSLLTPQRSESGYTVYVLRINRKAVYRFAHIVVAKQFIPNDDPKNKVIVNHIDEDPRNPCVDNLEWVTRSENAKYGNAQNKINIGRNNPINEYSLAGRYLRTWKSGTGLLTFYGLDKKVLTYLISILQNNDRTGSVKKVFGRKVFLHYDGACNDLDFKISQASLTKYKNLVFDVEDIPEEYLYNEDSLTQLNIDVIKKLMERIKLTKSEHRALINAVNSMKALTDIKAIIQKHSI